MHGENNIKYINAQQASLIYKHRNIKVKLQKTNAAILFNKMCRAEKLQPTYININVSGNNSYKKILHLVGSFFDI
jgi:hypothetical protein